MVKTSPPHYNGLIRPKILKAKLKVLPIVLYRPPFSHKLYPSKLQIPTIIGIELKNHIWVRLNILTIDLNSLIIYQNHWPYHI